MSETITSPRRFSVIEVAAQSSDWETYALSDFYYVVGEYHGLPQGILVTSDYAHESADFDHWTPLRLKDGFWREVQVGEPVL